MAQTMRVESYPQWALRFNAMVQKIADDACKQINAAAPDFVAPWATYTAQGLLEALIRELEKRV